MLLKLHPRDKIRQTGHGTATWYTADGRQLYYIYNGKGIIYLEIWINQTVLLIVEQKPIQYLEMNLPQVSEHFIKGSALKGKPCRPPSATLEEMVLVPFASEGLSPRLANAIKNAIVTGHGGPLQQLSNLEGHQVKTGMLLLPDARFSSKKLLKDSRVQMIVLVTATILWIVFLIFGFLIYLQYKKNQTYIPWIKL